VRFDEERNNQRQRQGVSGLEISGDNITISGTGSVSIAAATDVQELTFDKASVAGTFSLSFANMTVSGIAFDPANQGGNITAITTALAGMPAWAGTSRWPRG